MDGEAHPSNTGTDEHDDLAWSPPGGDGELILANPGARSSIPAARGALPIRCPEMDKIVRQAAFHYLVSPQVRGLDLGQGAPEPTPVRVESSAVEYDGHEAPEPP